MNLIVDYYHAIQVNLPAHAGDLGATYAILIIYVPVLMITHVIAFYLLIRPGWSLFKTLPPAQRELADVVRSE